MGIRESLLNTITSVADSDFVRVVTEEGASCKATVKNLFKSFETNLSTKSDLTASDYVRVVGSNNEVYKQTITSLSSTIMDAQAVENLNDATDTGFYGFASDASNHPYTGYPGTLEVINSDVITQIASVLDRLYVRRFASGAWESWTLIPTRSEIDALNTVQTITFTPNSGFTSNLFIRKVGKVVTVNGYITATNAFGSSETIVGNIPSGSRPGSTIRAAAGISSAAYSPGDVAYVAIGTGGNLAITAKSGNTYKNAYFSISYAAQN